MATAGAALRAFLARNKVATLILATGLAIRVPLVFLPPDRLGAVWRASDTASIAHNFAQNGHRLLYPQIHWGGAGPGYVEAEFQLYPFLVSFLYALFGERFWLGRLVSWGFTLGTCVLFHVLARRLCGDRVALWALAFFVSSPIYIRYSVQFMPEATVMFFYTGALLWFHAWLGSQRLRHLLLAGVSTALAILVKPTSIHIGLVFLLLLLQGHRRRALASWRVWLLAVICLLPGTLWYLHARNLYLRYGNTFGVLSGGDNKFGRVLDYWTSWDFYSSLMSIELYRVFSVAGAVFCVLGLVLLVRRREPALLLWGMISVAVYYMVIPRYSSFASYYHLYVLPYAAMLVGHGANELIKPTVLSWPTAWRKAGPLIALALIAIMLSYEVVFYRSLIHESHFDRACASAVAAVVPEGARIVVSSVHPERIDGVANNYQDPTIFFFSQRYGWSLPPAKHMPEVLEGLRKQGARYFVMRSQKLYELNPRLVDYLSTSAVQVGPGIEASCAVYRLGSGPPAMSAAWARAAS